MPKEFLPFVCRENHSSAYPLPCYVNAWLRQYPWYPGSYPCGGPVVEMHPIWKATAPSLFALAPDIYVPYVPAVLDEYTYATEDAQFCTVCGKPRF